MLVSVSSERSIKTKWERLKGNALVPFKAIGNVNHSNFNKDRSHIVIKLGANEREIDREKNIIKLVVREGARLVDDQREL